MRSSRSIAVTIAAVAPSLLPLSRAWRRAAPRPLQHGAGADGFTAAAPTIRPRTRSSPSATRSAVTVRVDPGRRLGVPTGNGRADVFVNHETSTVPFPYNSRGLAARATQNDFTNSELSPVELQPAQGRRSRFHGDQGARELPALLLELPRNRCRGLLRGPSSSRTKRLGLGLRSGTAWPGRITPGCRCREAGVIVAHDVKNGKTKSIYGMGRHNHENRSRSPGSTNSSCSRVTTRSRRTRRRRSCTCTPPATRTSCGPTRATPGVRLDDATTTTSTSPTAASVSITGKFVKVPKDVRHGQGCDRQVVSDGLPGAAAAIRDGAPLQTGRSGSSTNGGMRRTTSTTRTFSRFVRVEDIAYDRNRPECRVPGRLGTRLRSSSRRQRSAAKGKPLDERPYLEDGPWNEDDPTIVQIRCPSSSRVTIHLTAREDLAGAFAEIHQPDNIETTPNGSLFVTEDPSSNNQYALHPREGRTRRRRGCGDVDLDARTRMLRRQRVTAAEVDQALDEQKPGVRRRRGGEPAGTLAAGSRAAIVDVSSVFGPGAYLDRPSRRTRSGWRRRSWRRRTTRGRSSVASR